MPLLCPLCPDARTRNLQFTTTDYLKHLRLFHAHQPNFHIMCGISGCQRTFKNFGTFKNHVSERHGTTNSIQPDVDPWPQSCDEDQDGISTDSFDTAEDSGGGILTTIQRSSANFLMGLKAEKRITQAALQGVIEGVTVLNQTRLSLLYQEVSRILEADGVAHTSIENLAPLFDESGIFGRPFMGLETQYQQDKYYSTNFGLIEPTRVVLGERRVWKGAGSKRKCVAKKDELIYVPLLETLQSCFSNPTFAEQITAERLHSDFMEDYCDGEVFKNHPLFSQEKKALQLLLYYDEVEICNPLGSKRKIHKLGMFYFHLGNVHPKHRSKLSSIQLLCIVKSKHMSEYGMDTILKPIVADIKKLEAGVHFEVRGKSEVYYGTVAVFSADNLGSLLLGGFKESCSAEKCCRHCLATRTTSKQKFLESDFILRDKASHEQHCAEIEADTTGAKSKEYGVNRNSILNKLSYFHVCEGGLLPDVMHDLLEGALQYEVKAMLNVMIYTEPYFTLEYLNTRLQHLELGYMEVKNRPTLLEEIKIRAPTGLSLNQNASQMWLLSRVLPLLVGDRIPEDDERWQNFLVLMEIVDRLFCPKLTEDDATYIKCLINEHHCDFISLYPQLSVIPKMHFMVHMPRLINQFGPLVRHWTMRFEGKHCYFKQLAHSMGNFINLPYSLAMRHQQLQCYRNSSISNNSSDLTVGPGTVIACDALQDQVDEPITSVYLAKWIVKDGVEYRKGVGVVYQMEDDLPLVGQVNGISVVNGGKVFLEVDCFCSYYESHYRVYVLKALNSVKTITITDLCLPHPIHIRTASVLPGLRFVILPHFINV